MTASPPWQLCLTNNPMMTFAYYFTIPPSVWLHWLGPLSTPSPCQTHRTSELEGAFDMSQGQWFAKRPAQSPGQFPVSGHWGLRN